MLRRLIRWILRRPDPRFAYIGQMAQARSSRLREAESSAPAARATRG